MKTVAVVMPIHDPIHFEAARSTSSRSAASCSGSRSLDVHPTLAPIEPRERTRVRHVFAHLRRRHAPRQPAMVHLAIDHPHPARTAAVARLGDHHLLRDRYRARHREDRQGGRRVPHRARRIRPRSSTSVGAARGEALSRRQPSRLPSLGRVPGGPPDAAQPRPARHDQRQRIRSRARRRAVGVRGVRRAHPDVAGRRSGALPAAGERHRDPDGVHRHRRPGRPPPRAGASRVRPCCGTTSRR